MCAACASDGNTTIAGGPDDAVTSAPPQRIGCRRAGFVDATAVERAVRELEHARRRRQVREHVADDGDGATAVRQVAGGAGIVVVVLVAAAVEPARHRRQRYLVRGRHTMVTWWRPPRAP